MTSVCAIRGVGITRAHACVIGPSSTNPIVIAFASGIDAETDFPAREAEGGSATGRRASDARLKPSRYDDAAQAEDGGFKPGTWPLNHRREGATTSASSSHRPVLSRVHTRTYAPACGAAPAISYLPKVYPRSPAFDASPDPVVATIAA